MSSCDMAPVSRLSPPCDCFRFAPAGFRCGVLHVAGVDVHDDHTSPSRGLRYGTKFPYMALWAAAMVIVSTTVVTSPSNRIGSVAMLYQSDSDRRMHRYVDGAVVLSVMGQPRPGDLG